MTDHTVHFKVWLVLTLSALPTSLTLRPSPSFLSFRGRDLYCAKRVFAFIQYTYFPPKKIQPEESLPRIWRYLVNCFFLTSETSSEVHNIEDRAIIGLSNLYVSFGPKFHFLVAQWQSAWLVIHGPQFKSGLSLQGAAGFEPQLANYKVKALPLSYKRKGKFFAKKKSI